MLPKRAEADQPTFCRGVIFLVRFCWPSTTEAHCKLVAGRRHGAHCEKKMGKEVLLVLVLVHHMLAGQLQWLKTRKIPCPEG